MKLILASASPRRREILAALGVDFDIHTSDADEHCDLSDPGERVMTIASRKCAAVVADLTAQGQNPDDTDTMVLAADTLVTIDGQFLGKPADEADARRMIELLAGRTHTVVSGLCIYYRGRMVTAHESTGVTFSAMTAGDVDRYLATGESFGKAGGYAIQGHAARYITGIDGDYFNVVGLPVHRLYDTLAAQFDIHL